MSHADAQVHAVQRRMAHALNRTFVDALVAVDHWPLDLTLDCLLLCGNDSRTLQERYWAWTAPEAVLLATSGAALGECFLQHLQRQATP